MSHLHPARRNAERFDALVESHRPAEVDDRTAELLELVGAMRAVPSPRPRPEFASELRAQLLAAAATELTPVARAPRERATVADRLTVAPSRTGRERRLGLALGTLAVIGGTTLTGVASQAAIPGDALYPIKRAIESTQTGFTVSDDAKGRSMLGNAGDRLDEVRELAGQDQPDTALVIQTLGTFADQATQAGDLLMSDYDHTGDAASVERLNEFTGSSMTTLAELDGVLPGEAHQAVLDAAEALFTLNAAAQQTCPECGGTGITEIPGTLLTGASTGAQGEQLGEAGGQLPGTQPSSSPAEVQAAEGGDEVSGLNPPTNPIQIPSQTAQPQQSAGPSDPLDGVLPTTGGQGHGGQGHGGGKGKPTKVPVGLSPVTGVVEGTVDGTLTTAGDVVDGVVQGVTGLLNGLTSQQTPTPGP